MARIGDVGDPEVSDDSVSLTSTVVSAQKERYEVKRILAERKRKGAMEYLTEWQGYAEHLHEWLPRENFYEDDVFSEWLRTKMRESRGLAEPFDVKTWEKRTRKTYEKNRLRRERRRDKKFRLSKQVDKLVSWPGEQDANIGSPSSEPAPKRSDKRIKRRSIHQDPPPSSSSSASSFSSNSEDSDRPLTSRQESELLIPNVRWTQVEIIALEEGLRTLRGPRWKDILGLYGRNGTISQALKDKTPGDLYDKAKNVRQEFVDSGREPPEYLKPFSKPFVQSDSSKGSGTATPNIYPESRVQSRAASKRTSRSTSADSMMAELHEKQRIRQIQDRENSRPQQPTKTREIPDSARGQEKQSYSAKKMSGSKPKAPQAAQAPARKLEVAPTEKPVEEPLKAAQANAYSKHAVPHTNGTKEVEEISKNDSLQGRQPKDGPGAKESSKINAVPEAEIQPKSLASSAKETIKPATNVTAAWNAEPNKRKSNNWATTNANSMDGQAPKRNYKLSVQNRIFKSRRDGREPDPNRLVFLDPKTGKAPTTVPSPSATTVLSKTPLQLHQEELTTREAQRRAQEVEEGMLVSTSEPDPPPQSIDQDRKIRVDEQGLNETDMSNTSASALKPTPGDMTDGSTHIDSHTPHPPVLSHLGLPLTIPLGPRMETKRMATMSLQDYTKRSISSTHLLDDAVVNSYQPHSSDELSNFTLRSYSSQKQKNKLFKQSDANIIIGYIKLGRDDEETIKVKLVDFAYQLKKLLLTVKSSPLTTHFVFETVCLASEYQAYFPAEPSDYLGSGSIVPYHQGISAVESIAETLANNLQGGLFFAQQYTMIMYPAGASAWAFLDNNLPNVHPGTTLRFVVRGPLPPILPHVHELAIARLDQENPERYAEITTKIEKYPIQAEDNNINIVFRDMFEIDFDRLVAQSGPQKHAPTNKFFLCFIPQGCEDYEPDPAKRSALRMRTSEEHDLFIRFLQANGAEEIYSMQKIGSQEIDENCAWDYFSKNVKSGTIVFHDAYIRYDLVPRLAKLLLHGSVNVWKTSLSPMDPGEKHSHLVRLFPHGGVLLLTESLVLYRPHETLRILMWFRLVHLPGRTPGTWKLAVRPRVREWLLDIIEACSDSGKDIFGCGIQIFADIYTEIYFLLQSPDPGDSSLMCYEWDYETPTEEAPIVSSPSLRVLQARKEWTGEGADMGPDDSNIRQNDDLLVQWFAEWAIVNLHSFRKYHVILGYAEDHPFTNIAIPAYEKAWGHIEVITAEDAFKRHGVIAQSKLDEVEAKRRRKVREELPVKRAAAHKARREEREATKRALDARMKMFRDVNATEEEVVRAGRQLLRDLGGSEKEIEECKVDMNRVFVDRWWEEPVKEGDVNMDEMNTTEVKESDEVKDAGTGTNLAPPRAQKDLADQQRAGMSDEAGGDGA